MKADKYLVIRGKLDWAKLTGPARPYKGNPKFDKGPLWSVDITPDAKSLDLLAAEGLTTGGSKGTGKLRTPKGNDTRTEKFLSLKILENRADGTKNLPPKIVDAQNRPWANGLIGNGTIGEIKVKVVKYDGADDGVYFQALRVLDHVPYEANDFAPLAPNDPYANTAGATGVEGQLPAHMEPAPVEEDLDDDVPF